MGKAVLISIRPQWCDLIASGKKSIEVRKTRPKLATPFRCYIYESLGKVKIKSMDIPTEQGGGTIDFYSHEGIGKIIGEFACDNIRCFDVPYPAFQKELDKRILYESCCTYYQLHRYAYHDALYGWHISELNIYDKPKELSEFTALRKTKFGYEPITMMRPPQSWCYVEELKG